MVQTSDQSDHLVPGKTWTIWTPGMPWNRMVTVFEQAGLAQTTLLDNCRSNSPSFKISKQNWAEIHQSLNSAILVFDWYSYNEKYS